MGTGKERKERGDVKVGEEWSEGREEEKGKGERIEKWERWTESRGKEEKEQIKVGKGNERGKEKRRRNERKELGGGRQEKR